jgi:hypothetical protein
MNTWLGPGPLEGLVLLLHAATSASAPTVMPRILRIEVLLEVK